MFTELIEKIVSINEDDYINVLLLDKINRREDVLKQLVKFQSQEILGKIPQYFSLPKQDRDDFIQHLKELQDAKLVIAQVSQGQAKLFNSYEKDGTKKAYPELYHLLEMLDRAATGYNRVWD